MAEIQTEAQAEARAEEWTQALKKSVGIRQLERVYDSIRGREGDWMLQRLCRIQQNAYAAAVGVDPPTDGEGQQASGEDMDVQVGDNEITINEGTRVENKHSKWAPIIGAVLLAAGLTGGVAITKILSGGADTDTQYQLGGPWSEAPTQ